MHIVCLFVRKAAESNSHIIRDSAGSLVDVLLFNLTCGYEILYHLSVCLSIYLATSVCYVALTRDSCSSATAHKLIIIIIPRSSMCSMLLSMTVNGLTCVYCVNRTINKIVKAKYCPRVAAIASAGSLASDVKPGQLVQAVSYTQETHKKPM